MDYSERMAFLQGIRLRVQADPSLLPEIIAAATDGMARRVSDANDKRAEAECCLVMAYDMIPKGQLAKRPSIRSRVHRVLKDSHLVGGTPFAQGLED